MEQSGRKVLCKCQVIFIASIVKMLLKGQALVKDNRFWEKQMFLALCGPDSSSGGSLPGARQELKVGFKILITYLDF